MTNTTIFLDLLKKKRGFYAAILELTQDEYKKFQANRPLNEIRPLLNQKKVLLACINALEAELIPFKSEIQATLQNLENPSAKVIQETINDLSSTLDEILRLDTLNQKHLQLHLNTIKSALV